MWPRPEDLLGCEDRPFKDRYNLNTSQFSSNAIQNRRLQKIISGWLIWKDLIEWMALVMALKSNWDF